MKIANTILRNTLTLITSVLALFYFAASGNAQTHNFDPAAMAELQQQAARAQACLSGISEKEINASAARGSAA